MADSVREKGAEACVRVEWRSTKQETVGGRREAPSSRCRVSGVRNQELGFGARGWDSGLEVGGSTSRGWGMGNSRDEGFACHEGLRPTRICRLINVFGKVGREYRKKKMLKKYERRQYVYENKQISDRMPAKKSDIFV